MNKNLRKLGLLAITLFFSNVIFSQSTVCDSTHWAKPGTYEIVTIQGSTEATSISKVTIPNTTLCEIESMRKQNQIVEYKLNYCTLIRIYPNTNPSKTVIEK
jgi:hypothetical protein